MSFSTARRVLPVLAGLAVACTIGSMALRDGNYSLALVLTIAALVFLAAAVLVMALWLKCPHCGKRLIQSGIRIDKCPYCQKKLTKS